jgi:hypothetical protein
MNDSPARTPFKRHKVQQFDREHRCWFDIQWCNDFVSAMLILDELSQQDTNKGKLYKVSPVTDKAVA